MPEKLLELAESENILVDYFILPADLLGVYYRTKNMPPVILLHSRLKDNRRLLRCVFAEEMGHHFTTGCNLMAFARISRHAALKYEEEAQWWATKYLIPFNELTEVVLRGNVEIFDIADHFSVTERFLWTSLRLYNEKMPRKMKALSTLLKAKERFL